MSTEYLDAAVAVARARGFLITYRLIGDKYYFECGNKRTYISKINMDNKRWDILARNLEILTNGDQ